MRPPTLTPAQAQYIVTRLLNERRITHNDIAHALDTLHHEIATIEERLTTLGAPRATRTATPTTPHTPDTPSNTRIPSNTRTPSNKLSSNTPRKARRFSPAARAQQKVQGSYLGYMRQVPERDKPRFQTIRARKGFTAAITALRNHLKK